MKLKVSNKKVELILKDIKDAYLSISGYTEKQWEIISSEPNFFEVEYYSYSYKDLIEYYLKKIKENPKLISIQDLKKINKNRFSREDLQFSDYNFFFCIYARFLYYETENKKNLNFDSAKSDFKEFLTLEDEFLECPNQKELVEFMLKDITDEEKKALMVQCSHESLSSSVMFSLSPDICAKCALVDFEQIDLYYRYVDEDKIKLKIKDFNKYIKKNNFLNNL